jgi:hypothetical protein
MKIKETYIVEEDGKFIKLHYCLNSQGTKTNYFKEYENGVIIKITCEEFYKILKDY